MSLVLTGSVALAYAAGVVGVHRLTVARRRAAAGGYPALRWLDWDTLLAGLLPAAPEVEGPPALPREGGPTPRLLRREGGGAAVEALRALVTGAALAPGAFAAAGFSGGEARWLELLARARGAPGAALAELEGTPPATVAEVALREWLTAEHSVSALSLELATFASKRRLAAAFARFGEQPALAFARARASSLLGFTEAVLDDLARAVYFSGQAPFYLEAVLAMPFVGEARPALLRACLEARGTR